MQTDANPNNSNQIQGRWHVAIDRGGTFTDAIASRDGEVRVAKVPTIDLLNGLDAGLRAIRKVLGISDEVDLDDQLLASIRLGTTAATNALLTRSGEPTTLVLTAGLRDLPVIGDQARPQLFDLDIVRPEPIASQVIEAVERVGVDGVVITPLDEIALRSELLMALSSGCTSLAVSLLHGWRHDVHERRIAEIAAEIGFTEVVTSRMSPLPGYVARIDTVALDASLTPVLHAAVRETASSIHGVSVRCMQSSGGLVEPEAFRGCRAVLSGPAGGLVGAAGEGHRHGFDRVIALDMGGTSTDVSWCSGELERDTDAVVGGLRVRVPMLRVHTVAAGGGSVCQTKSGRLRVGPESAGAAPGPACYGLGGPATITDCHVVLGRLPVAAMPSVFGLSGDACIDPSASWQAIEAMSGSTSQGVPQVAAGFLDVAVECIAGAIRQVSIEQGHDVRHAVVCAFGGAAGQLACRIASRLDVDQVLIPIHAGVLSAQGISIAEIAAVRSSGVGCDLGDLDQLNEVVRGLREETSEELTDQGADIDRVEVTVAVRGHRWDRTIPISLEDPASMDLAYRQACLERFGFEIHGPLVAESVEVRSVSASAHRVTAAPSSRESLGGTTRMWVDGEWRDVGVVSGSCVDRIDGPAVVVQDGATIVLEPGWQASRHREGGLVLSRCRAAAPPEFDATTAAGIEIANRRFLSICREMGTVLQHTACSVNVKERRDYSCAVFDADGRLVANGPHMPVHLGSMGESVRRVLQVHGDRMLSGDVFVDNDPAFGGTHLPDLTVVSPVFHGKQCEYVVASRAHHADVGGTTPGSMPSDSSSLSEEGVVFNAEYLVRSGEFLEERMRSQLLGSLWPARQPDVNIDDLRAQVGANMRGMRLLDAMRLELSGAGMAAAMAAVRHNAAACVREALRSHGGGAFESAMDDGGVVRVHVRPAADHTIIDFSGTSSQRPGNTNAPLAVTRSAVLYVLRCLVADDIPLNDGCMDSIKLIVPDGSMLSPRQGAAVVGGNVETSQIIVDALLGAFGVQAASQGTMNNLTFGDDSHQYYETICGGSGGGAGLGSPFCGEAAVHTHMTNSLLTDPEILEDRFPVRLERFCIRIGSGGSGRFAGGDGAIRQIRFLSPMQVSFLAGRRIVPPHGLKGGGDGAVGSQCLIHRNGRVEQLPGSFRKEVVEGDTLRIETPGGGGWLAE
ncbi:MAG: 5-oxoprolinase [Planctomycetes bacterium]|jgi:5-oxoprolinase (ATP-hydrolysing)|nr:5-oxoprolinase [Planctomycetota bacterium]MCP4838631.1 5-oxoprolinase [Planctomycetota bacterium]